jgi:hypothetical protein
MDPRTFDCWTASVAHQRSRRTALRALAGGLLGGLLSPHLAWAAQRSDRDGDGLFDDDEVQVYGTNPDVYDTDGDGFGDGEEVYYGSNPVAADSYTGVVGDGNDVGLGANPDEGLLLDGDPAGSVAVACREIGVACDYDIECCNNPVARCCWDGVSLRTECTDVSAYGNVCPM